MLPLHYTPMFDTSQVYIILLKQSTINPKIIAKKQIIFYNVGMKNITLYTDGACSYNPGPGGYGAILIYDGKEKETTINREQETDLFLSNILLL